jgi:hypothetical protein
MATKKENRPEGKNNEHDDNEMNKMSPDERIAWLRERVSRPKVAAFPTCYTLERLDWNESVVLESPLTFYHSFVMMNLGSSN